MRLKQGITLVIFVNALSFFACAAGGDQNDAENAIFQLSFDPAFAEASVIKLINDSRKTIDISLYELENDNIANAIIEAYERRGVQVRASTDYDSEHGTGYQKLILKGIDVRLGNGGAIMHNKYILVDQKYVITGSTNLKGDPPPYASGMYVHFNNMAIIKSPELAADYKRDLDVQYGGIYGTAAGQYGGSKEAAYNGGAQWPEQKYQLGSQTVQAFFTPYNKNFSSYSANLANDPLCSSIACLDLSSTSNMTASCGPTLTCSFHACYQDTCTGSVCPRTIYHYYNYDKSQYECSASSAGSTSATTSDVYKSALNVVINQIRQAKKSLTFLVFAFTDRVIMDELKNAKARGLDVKVWMDYNQYRSSYRNSGASFVELRKQLGWVKLCRKWDSGLLHHKVLLIDDNKVILGSMNYSNAGANDNDENFLLIENAEGMVGMFKQEIGRIDQQSFYLPPVEDDGYYISNTGD
jgi:phosphatidylserine/phosphatidylglycerophosphate/cardiolipin synthase-like enzyme